MPLITRRQLAAVLGGAMTLPITAGAQEARSVRRIGALMNYTADDPESALRVSAFAQGLQELGWMVGRNLRVEYRWAAGDPERYRRYAAELLALMPEVILAAGGTSVRALQSATRKVPIVFAGVTDPVQAGYVASLSRPAGNITGFTNFEYGISTKWLELLRQIAPSLKRVLVFRETATAAGDGQVRAIQSVASALGIELTPGNVAGADSIEHDLTEFAREPNGGLIVANSALATRYREAIVALAAQHRLPAIYPARRYAISGGLMSYGVDGVDQFRRAATYIDRILKGETPADLPVQAPTKYELIMNLGTAKAQGLEIPAQLLATADEVIE
jgi:putative tryptophan/tyrosine transport system substrate-binding protein